MDTALDAVRQVLEKARSRGLIGQGPAERHLEHSREFSTVIQGLVAAKSSAALETVVDPHRPADASLWTVGWAASNPLVVDTGNPPGSLRIVDLGSGAGLPGLVIAALLPMAEIVLLEGSTRRAEFLEESVGSCGFDKRVSVVALRAEEAGRMPTLRGAFDVVVARAFGPPPVTAECAAPLLRVNGCLVVSEPPDAGYRWPEAGLGLLEMRPHAPVVSSSYHYQVIQQVAACPGRFPRRVGVPTKRPLF